MIRRRLLVGILGCACLGACASLPASSARRAAPGGDSRAGTGQAEQATTSLGVNPGSITLEVKPVGDSGALARITGHCDLDGVIAAHGSSELAKGACDRDLEVEQDLAEGLKISGASVLHNEARVQHLSGNTERARQDYQEAIRQDTEGRSPSAVSKLARVNLGLLHHEQGDQAAAEQHLQWVLGHATDPAVRGAAYHNLSLVLLELDQTDAALDAAQQGHALLLQTLGDTHGSVGAALNALGVIHAERGELDEAVEALEAAVEVRAAALGQTHPATAASYTNLGVALGRRGDWDAALHAHREALAIDQEVLGPDHATTAADHGHLGATLMELGRPHDARPRFERALAILTPVRPDDDPEVEQLRGWLVVCDEAEALARAKPTDRARPDRAGPIH
ncbi:MAG: tetratricopeptide repeat protein [Myxococcota bacterium]